MSTLSDVTLEALSCAGLDADEVARVVRTALDEDLRLGPDVTTLATVEPGVVATAELVTRRSGVIAGLPVVLAVLDIVDASSTGVHASHQDGDAVPAGTTILRMTGALRPLLTAERTLLNLLCHLSGIATLTRAWTQELNGTGAVVRDTRKTTPGLRLLEKYAVRCGGGTNHRMALGDTALIKDNHVIAAGGVTAAVQAVRSHAPGMPLEVECDTVEQVREAIAAGVGLVLLDNMSIQHMLHAVALARSAQGVRLEASGGLTLDRVRAVACTGVDYVAVGALTHSAPALDIGMDLRIAQ